MAAQNSSTVLKKVGCRALILAPNTESANHIDILRAVAPEIDHCAPGKLEAARACPNSKSSSGSGSDHREA